MHQRSIILMFLISVAVLSTCLVPASMTLAAEAGPDQGQVVFHRKDVFKGKAIRFNIEQDGVPIGQLLAGTTIERSLAPGNYVFSVRAPSLDGADFITISVEPGHTYNVEGEILWGWPAGRPKFRMVSESGYSPGPASPSAPTGALAEAALGSAVVSAQSRPDAAEQGKIGLNNLIGDWSLDMWSLGADGSKLTGNGVAVGTAEGESATRVLITEFQAAAFPAATGGGQILISYEPDRGFLLVSNFRYSDEVLRFSGQYQADTGKYVFYLFGGVDGEIVTGVTRSSVRVEVESLNASSWVAETYSSVDGRQTKVQSYRFTRR